MCGNIPRKRRIEIEIEAEDDLDDLRERALERRAGWA